MNWILNHIDVVVPVLIGVGLATVACIIVVGMRGSPDARMVHENEPQEPREWRSANWKPLNNDKHPTSG